MSSRTAPLSDNARNTDLGKPGREGHDAGFHATVEQAAVDGDGRGQDSRGHDGKEQCDDIGAALEVAELREPAGECHAEQEREDDLYASLDDTELLKEFYQVPVGPLLRAFMARHWRVLSGLHLHGFHCPRDDRGCVTPDKACSSSSPVPPRPDVGWRLPLRCRRARSVWWCT
jgi:hypothetical protein